MSDKFFGLARNAPTQFLRLYYERVAHRYLSSEDETEMRPDALQGDTSKAESVGT
jgi:hypothetical protein